MTSINTYSTTNTNRITGLATGMDTDAMVKAMTANYQAKIDKMGQDKQIMQWKQEFYRDIVKEIKGLQDYFDPISDKYIMSPNKFNPMRVTNSNEDALGITTDSTAQKGSYKINVTQLAKPAVIEGATNLKKADGTEVKLDTKLSDLDPSVSGDITFTINDKSVNIKTDTNTTIKDVIDGINAEIQNNADLKGKVTASFDELSKKVVFSATATGEDAKLSIASSALGFSDYGYGITSKGQNANFTITYPDGRTVDVKDQKTNKFTANGITYDLKTAGSGDVTFSVDKNNTDEIVKNLKTFFDDYNKIIEKIEGKLTEKKQFTYKPLTDAQRKDMKEDDIKKWEEKAKQGILKNDDYLSQLMSDLRGNIFERVYNDKSGDKKNGLYMGVYGDEALGLDTSRDFKERGKIFIKDEDKLKKAIENNIEDFTKFFIGKSATKNDSDKYIGTDTYYEDGLLTRIDKIIRQYAGDPAMGKDGMSTLKGALNIYANKQYDYSITGTVGKNTMPDKIYSKVLSIGTLEKKMTEAQARYYQKFARLETAMNKLNSQMNAMYSQFGMNG
ncbi:flagellar filament capping protein FliD [Clostridium sporogenes]|uniref:Flagellar hook-associated protein 2 n=1 Tax=Clostridium sporogenes TaxID=1509 RepID=A0AAE4FKD1_CLOSG|nr:flagellar filament capping protein FliD [Clostridium sporogenes]MDS1002900.1 flagellar filament capping protein FliD [Clostridium sporogenes]